jgi:hypothetical protein
MDPSPIAGGKRSDRATADVECALRALVGGVGRLGLKRLAVEEIDGVKARRSTWVESFLRAGFRLGYRGLEVDRIDPTAGPTGE